MAKAKNTLSDADIEQLQKVLTETPEGRRWLADHSWKYFAKYYLHVELRDYQIEWLEFLDRKPNAGVLAPVAHGKTFAVARIFVLKKVLYNRNIRILLLSGTEDKAKENLQVISNELRNNGRIIEDFGHFYVPAAGETEVRNWTKTKIQVARDQNLPDPTVKAAGIGGNITGGRYDLIVLDDVVTEDNANSETERKKILRKYNTTIEERLDKGGSVIFIGTRYDYADLYGHFLKQAHWDIRIDKAIIEEPEDYEFVTLDTPELDEDGLWIKAKVIIRGNRGKCLDPINRPMEYLLQKRYSHGTRNFNLVYQNIVTSDETALIKLEWLEACRNEDISYAPIRVDLSKGAVNVVGSYTPSSRYVGIVRGTDPAIVTDKETAEASDSSYFVSITAGVLPNGHIEVIHLFRERGLTPKQKLEVVERLDRIFKPEFHYYEENAFGAQDIWRLTNETGVPIVKHHTGKNKNNKFKGVPKLGVKFENRRILLPYKTENDRIITDIIIDELHRFPGGEHDDILMAFWINDGAVEHLDSWINYQKTTGRN